MQNYDVLLPAILFDGSTETSLGIINNEKGKFHIIDNTNYNGGANDCRDLLINHHGYNKYIICVESK